MAYVETAGGIALPGIAFGSGGITISTTVDGGRNENNDFIGSVVGDDKFKMEMAFPKLSPEQMRLFLSIWDRKQGGAFVNEFIVFDPRVNDFVKMKMYVGDRTGRPYTINKRTFRPEFWVDVKANLIQV